MMTLTLTDKVHHLLIERFGGSQGIRDRRGLEAALARPYATFDGIDLYPSGVDKAAALLESLIIAHPFVDGNKRISYALMRLTLQLHGLEISATQDEKYAFVIAASTGEMRYDALHEWLSTHTVHS